MCCQGKLIDDNELKMKYANRLPYADYLKSHPLSPVCHDLKLRRICPGSVPKTKR